MPGRFQGGGRAAARTLYDRVSGSCRVRATLAVALEA